MAGTERTHDVPRDTGDGEDGGGPQVTAQAHDEKVDALLEEIDDVLETNAESFVKGFVQKGGQ